MRLKFLLVLQRDQLRSRGLSGEAETLASDLLEIAPECTVTVTGLELRDVTTVDLLPAAADDRDSKKAAALLGYLDGDSVTLEGLLQAGEFRRSSMVPVRETVHGSTREAEERSGIARLGFITRRPGMSPEAFGRHWLRHHGPLVMAHEPLFSRYVANLPIDVYPYDGVVEQWFKDEATWAEHDRRILEERPEVRADIPQFVGAMKQYAAVPRFVRRSLG